MRVRFVVLPVVLTCVAAPARDARACSGDWPGRDAAHDWPGRLVDSATAVARVRAVRADSAAPAPGGFPGEGTVTFAVVEWLRPPGGVPAGRAAAARPDSLVLAGEFVPRDDYNAGAVPYTFVRPDGARGACFAYAYRAGGEYVLLLRRDGFGGRDDRGGALSPYWAALAPVNEQVRGARDPWVAWVRERLRAGGGHAGGRRPA